MTGMDPQKVAELHKVSGKNNAEIRILYRTNEIHLKLIPTTPESAAWAKSFLPTFAETMATQLGVFFNIKGEIIDVGKYK